eukprot:TRINITY_DN11871_c2_g2_i1.p1 TRINITY_DN11871_c2_g2~~TRINITY_DN11871_c2_g2_i1.p1  ORF type:complete len:257 (-),score=49.36 TRINITY_DN11871_c2_g2_i1:288-992(-)
MAPFSTRASELVVSSARCQEDALVLQKRSGTEIDFSADILWKLKEATSGKNLCNAHREDSLLASFLNYEAVHNPYLTVWELLSVQAVSSAIRDVAVLAENRTFADISVPKLAAPTKMSFHGRVRKSCESKLQDMLARKLEACFTLHRVARHIRRIDLAGAPMMLLNPREVGKMLHQIPNLSVIRVPSTGWADTLQKVAFLAALPDRVSVEGLVHNDVSEDLPSKKRRLVQSQTV